jgi:hypothetical protein
VIEIIDIAGKTLAEEGIKGTASLLASLSKVLIDHYQILSQEVILNCGQQTQEISLAIEVKKGKIAPSKIRFPFGKPTRVDLRPLRTMAETNNSVIQTSEGFELNTKDMTGDDLFLLSITYQGLDKNFEDALVRKDFPKENPKGSESEYWLHAELKHPSLLKEKYARLDLRDITFDVNVDVSRDIKMVIPSAFRIELDAAVALLQETNPHEILKVGRRHIAAKRGRPSKENVLKILSDMQSLFLPNKFSTFVNVREDFSYYNCERGLNFYDKLPFPTWPRTMRIVSRTDLNLTKLTATGSLLYKKDDFLDKIRKILGI